MSRSASYGDAALARREAAARHAKRNHDDFHEAGIKRAQERASKGVGAKSMYRRGPPPITFSATPAAASTTAASTTAMAPPLVSFAGMSLGQMAAQFAASMDKKKDLPPPVAPDQRVEQAYKALAPPVQDAKTPKLASTESAEYKEVRLMFKHANVEIMEKAIAGDRDACRMVRSDDIQRYKAQKKKDNGRARRKDKVELRQEESRANSARLLEAQQQGRWRVDAPTITGRQGSGEKLAEEIKTRESPSIASVSSSSSSMLRVSESKADDGAACLRYRLLPSKFTDFLLSMVRTASAERSERGEYMRKYYTEALNDTSRHIPSRDIQFRHRTFIPVGHLWECGLGDIGQLSDADLYLASIMYGLQYWSYKDSCSSMYMANQLLLFGMACAGEFTLRGIPDKIAASPNQAGIWPTATDNELLFPESTIRTPASLDECARVIAQRLFDLTDPHLRLDAATQREIRGFYLEHLAKMFGTPGRPFVRAVDSPAFLNACLCLQPLLQTTTTFGAKMRAKLDTDSKTCGVLQQHLLIGRHQYFIYRLMALYISRFESSMPASSSTPTTTSSAAVSGAAPSSKIVAA